MKKKLRIYFIVMIALWSCEKEITLPFDQNQSLLVIDASVTDEAGPYSVKLTKSLAITDVSKFPEVTNATVTIKDNFGQSETLKYTSNGIYMTDKLKGIVGHTYFLEVQLDGKKYTAQSTMPEKVLLDSLSLNNFTIFSESDYSVIPVYTDPITFGNNYRFIQKINDTLDKTYFVYNDNLINGFVNERSLISDVDSLYIKLNDWVSVEMQSISSQTYLYYYSLRQISRAGPGGGTTPSNPSSNIVGGALGIFSAHTVQRKKIQIK